MRKEIKENLENRHMKKIVHVTTYYPPHLGGQENIVQKLSENLTIEGFKNTILTSDQGGTAGITIENNMTVNRMRSINFAHAAIIWTLLVKLIRQTNSETIVDLHVGQAYTPETVWLASKVKGFKYIAHIYRLC